jgi:UDP-N-acetylmuramoyl-L-alanyl-D-glutamate--2,6-diaminopimelate ligase
VKFTSGGSGYNKHNYNIRIIVIILKDILYKVAIEAVHGSTEVAVGKTNLIQEKLKNDVFVAIRGSVSDGHDYIQKQSN